MSLTEVVSIFTAILLAIGAMFGWVQTKSVIDDGKRKRADHDAGLKAEGRTEGFKEGRTEGYTVGFAAGKAEGLAAGVASQQAQIFDLKNQVTTLTDDRNYWRGRNGGGRDDRREEDDDRR